MACLKLLVSDEFQMFMVHIFSLYLNNWLTNPILLLSFHISLVSVGFEYESCPEFILWEKRTAVLQGYETTASKLGGWTIDKHHALNIHSGESTKPI